MYLADSNILACLAVSRGLEVGIVSRTWVLLAVQPKPSH